MRAELEKYAGIMELLLEAVFTTIDEPVESLPKVDMGTKAGARIGRLGPSNSEQNVDSRLL